MFIENYLQVVLEFLFEISIPKLYTHTMPESLIESPSVQKKSVWQKTSYANLVRNQSSGNYFARIKIKGKLIWKTLKTAKLSVART